VEDALPPKLPVTTGQASGLIASAAREPAGGTTSRPLKLLYVEDHADTANLLERYLRMKGHTAYTAQDIASAIAMAAEQKGRFDLVLSDLGLPDGSGLDLMRLLRARYGLVGVCLTVFGSEEDFRHSREAGFAEHLTKPIDFDRLDRILMRLTES
jgi:DNA-binding response OmpR family regulator